MSDLFEQELDLYPGLPPTLPPMAPPPPNFFTMQAPHYPPSLSAPANGPPSLSVPTFVPPSLSVPTFVPPSLSAPAYVPPSLSAPTNRPPTLSAPAYVPPSLSVSTFVSPSLSAPAYVPPSLSAPTNGPPTLSGPTNGPPTWSAPTNGPSSLSTPTNVPPSLSTPTNVPPSLSLPTFVPPSLSAATFVPPSLSAATFVPPSLSAPAYVPPPLGLGPPSRKPEVPSTSASAGYGNPPQGHENANRGKKRQRDSDGSGQINPPNQSARAARPEPDLRGQVVIANQRSKDIQDHFRVKFRETLEKLTKMHSAAIQEGFKWADMVAKSIQTQMNFTRTYVTIGVDSLMVAVEIRDDPMLRGKPFIVCSRTMVHGASETAKAAGVTEELTVAAAFRKRGDLIVVEADFPKYIAVIKEIRNILRVYDEELRMTIDSAHLDLTTYMQRRAVMQPYISVLDVVHEMRTKIYNRLRLSTYAGIGPTPLLSKMASASKRPNKVHYIESSREAVEAFLKGMRMSEHCGICPRTTYVLQTLVLETIDDIWEKRSILYFLMSPRAFRRLIAICLGGNVDDATDRFQVWDLLPRSITKQVNMYPTRNGNFLKKVSAEVCIQMEMELKSLKVAGQLVFIAITTAESETIKRIFRLRALTNDAALLFKMLSRFLGRFMKQLPTVLISEIRMHMLQLSKVEFIAPSNTIICEKNVFPKNQEGDESDTTSATDDASDSEPIKRSRPTTPRVLCKVVPFPEKPKAVFICPNCSLRIQPGTDHNGENLMARHVDYCLMATFPDLGVEPGQ